MAWVILSSNRKKKGRKLIHIPNPKWFKPEEFFPPEIIAINTVSGKLKESIWRLMDWRILWTCDALRKRFGPMKINDYLWGGANQYRGFRPFKALVNKDFAKATGGRIISPKWSSFSSQHCFGRAIDANFKNYTAEEVRQSILHDSKSTDYVFITCIENGVAWVHFDCRSWDKAKNGILVVNPS